MKKVILAHSLLAGSLNALNNLQLEEDCPIECHFVHFFKKEKEKKPTIEPLQKCSKEEGNIQEGNIGAKTAETKSLENCLNAIEVGIYGSLEVNAAKNDILKVLHLRKDYLQKLIKAPQDLEESERVRNDDEKTADELQNKMISYIKKKFNEDISRKKLESVKKAWEQKVTRARGRAGRLYLGLSSQDIKKFEGKYNISLSTYFPSSFFAH